MYVACGYCAEAVRRRVAEVHRPSPDLIQQASNTGGESGIVGRFDGWKHDLEKVQAQADAVDRHGRRGGTQTAGPVAGLWGQQELAPTQGPQERLADERLGRLLDGYVDGARRVVAARHRHRVRALGGLDLYG